MLAPVAHVVLGLGSNLGARRALFACARLLLEGVPNLTVLSASRLYHTPPLGPPQPDYLNAALLVAWPHPLSDLLAHTQRIEQQLHRTRLVHWGARTLDIDILHSSDGSVSQPGLHVPHRELCNRSFALAPLLDVAPHLSASLGAALTALGGPPARSELWQPLFTRDHARAQVSPCAEPAELVSALACASCALAEPRAPVTPVTLVQPFQLPGAALHRACEAMSQQLRVAFGDGFHARAVAVTEVSAHEMRGVLVGVPAEKTAFWPVLRHDLHEVAGLWHASVEASART
jgi:2-amino-4-hydroxy-6-hydroxymethyldihydropteridine diphosphokinase